MTLWTIAPRLLCPWVFPGKNTEVDCYFLHQGIFLTQRLNPRAKPHTGRKDESNDPPTVTATSPPGGSSARMYTGFLPQVLSILSPLRGGFWSGRRNDALKQHRVSDQGAMGSEHWRWPQDTYRLGPRSTEPLWASVSLTAKQRR